MILKSRITFIFACISCLIVGFMLGRFENRELTSAVNKVEQSNLGREWAAAEKQGEEETYYADVLSLNKYNQISNGMSYSEVINILGSGQEISRSELAGYTTVMYMWQNNDGSNMNAMFQNSSLIQKAQFGLK